jgi:hypothetical protein
MSWVCGTPHFQIWTFSRSTTRGKATHIGTDQAHSQQYERFLEEKLYLEDASENTVASVEARLKEKGERWE